MSNDIEDSTERVRLLESWLPLAQAMYIARGWDKHVLSQEDLVLTASAALAKAHSIEAAAAVLTHFYEIRRGATS